MPPSSRRFVKTALLSLVAGVLLGAGMLMWQAITLTGVPYYLVIVHTHVLTAGFLVNMVMGVAYWMIPRPGGRTGERWATATWLCLNGGLLLRFVTEPFLAAPGGLHVQAGASLAGALQAAAALLFVASIWRRVMSPRERLERTGHIDG